MVLKRDNEVTGCGVCSPQDRYIFRRMLLCFLTKYSLKKKAETNRGMRTM
jgi:hypothetical protein